MICLGSIMFSRQEKVQTCFGNDKFFGLSFFHIEAVTCNTAHPFNTAVYCAFFSLLLESRKLVICEPSIQAGIIVDTG